MTAAALVRRLTEEAALRLGTDIQRRLGVKTSRQEPLARFTTIEPAGAIVRTESSVIAGIRSTPLRLC